MVLDTATVEVGDEYEHNEFGTVTVTKISEALKDAKVGSFEEDGIRLDSGTVDDTFVYFEKGDGTTEFEILSDFCMGVELLRENKN